MDDKLNVEKRLLNYTSYLRNDDNFIDTLSDDEFVEYLCVLNECYDYIGETYDE